MQLQKIGEFAKTFGLSVETIRFYQRQNLLPIPENKGGESNIRQYGIQETQRLKFIIAAKKAGFTLKEIKVLLAYDARSDREQIKKLSQRRISMLDKKMAELKQARDFLHNLVEECEATTSAPCPILKAFE